MFSLFLPIYIRLAIYKKEVRLGHASAGLPPTLNGAALLPGPLPDALDLACPPKVGPPEMEVPR
jgi:hypothetical protein